jgi:hypothetical protein
MDRRTFHKTMGLGLTGTLAGLGQLNAISGMDNLAFGNTEEQGPLNNWPRTYRRLLVDMHIPDWDPLFLSRFDAKKYVDTIAKSEFDTVMQYAHSHAGICFWPTKVGKPHAALNGRDFFGEIMDECKKHNLARIAYFSLIFDGWAWQEHPDWRMITPTGNFDDFRTRERWICPNNLDYREYLKAILTELASNYEFESIFLDMTYWPVVCYCDSCKRRFREEHQNEIPRKVDWNDPLWRKFQKSRENWMLEFGLFATGILKAVRPVMVNHQYSPIFKFWRLGMPAELNEACDYVGGDFYAGPFELSMACKVFDGFSRIKPFEFHTSRTVGLGDFESIKPEHEMQASAAVGTIHSAAKLFIDTMKPNGQLNERAYDYMAQANLLTKPYEPYLGGEMLSDIAVYFDKQSLFDPNDKRDITQLDYSRNTPHMDALLANCRILTENHIPYSIVTNINLDNINKHRALIISSVLSMTPEQAEKIRKFVANGGILISTGDSSMNHFDHPEKGFMLEDVLGVKFQGWLGHRFSYLSPVDEQISKVIWPQENISYWNRMVKAVTSPGAEVLATVTLPFVDPDDGFTQANRYSQIWSNPAGEELGTDPGIVVHNFGKGKSIWIAGAIEIGTLEKNHAVMHHLVKRFVPAPMYFEADTLPTIEMTLYDQPDKSRMLVGLANLLDEKASGDVRAVVRVKKPAGKNIRLVTLLPGEKRLHYSDKGDYVEFLVEPMESLAMALVNYV